MNLRLLKGIGESGLEQPIGIRNRRGLEPELPELALFLPDNPVSIIYGGFYDFCDFEIISYSILTQEDRNVYIR
jgi:hypothetical protein